MAYGSKYVNTSSARSFKKKRLPAVLSAIAVAAVAALAVIPIAMSVGSSSPSPSKGVSPVITVASADGGFVCADPKQGDLGGAMDNPDSWNVGMLNYPHPQANSRDFTLNEAVGKGMHFTTFQGVGESKEEIFGMKSVRDGLTKGQLKKQLDKAGTTDNQADAVFDKMSQVRDFANCTFNNAGNGIAGGILNFSSTITSITMAVSTWAFDPNIICKDPNKPGFGCVNLIGIIGGTSQSPGLLANLTQSIYMPLLVLVFLWVGISVVWKALKQQKFREAFLGAAWSVGVMLLGFIILLNPTIVAKAPMIATNTIANCVLGGFSGNNCVTGSQSSVIGNDDNLGSKAICNAGASVPIDEQISFTVGNMNCEIWRAFVLEPYSRSNFGSSFDQLYMSDPIMKKTVEKAGFAPESFCINLSSTKSVEVNQRGRLNLDGTNNKVCNLAAYAMFVGVDASTTSNGAVSAPPKNTKDVDPRWLKVATVAATDNGMWQAWQDSSFNKMNYSMMSVVISSSGNLVNLVISFFALVYYFIASIMLILLPFFLLIGIPDGRGRRLLLGYTGSLLSNIMKYAASAIMLVVTIALFSGVLKTMSDIFATFVVSLILTGALLMYRKEIVGLLGRVDLAGETMSNRFAEKLDRTKETALRTGGAAAGAMLATGTMNPADNLKAAAAGASDGFKRSVKARGGFAGNVVSQIDRATADNHRDLRAAADAAVEDSKLELAAASNFSAQADRAGDAIKSLDNDAIRAEGILDKESKGMDALRAAESRAIHSIQLKSPDLAELMALTSRLESIKFDINVARELGDTAEVSRLETMRDAYQTRASELQSVLPPANVEAGISYVDKTVHQAGIQEGIEGFTPEGDPSSERSRAVRRYEAARETVENYDAKRERLVEGQNNFITSANNSRRNSDRLKAEADSLNQAFIDKKPGDTITDREVSKLRSAAAAKGEEAAAKTNVTAATSRGDARVSERAKVRKIENFAYISKANGFEDILPEVGGPVIKAATQDRPDQV